MKIREIATIGIFFVFVVGAVIGAVTGDEFNVPEREYQAVTYDEEGVKVFLDGIDCERVE